MVHAGAIRQAAPLQTSANESGAQARYDFDPVVYWAPLSDKSSFQIEADLLSMFWRRAVVESVSAAGIGLSAKTKVEPGAYLVVELRRASLDFSRTVLVRVAKVGLRMDGGWTVSCVFEEPSSFMNLNEQT
jgi:hypothetical protein